MHAPWLVGVLLLAPLLPAAATEDPCTPLVPTENTGPVNVSGGSVHVEAQYQTLAWCNYWGNYDLRNSAGESLEFGGIEATETRGDDLVWTVTFELDFALEPGVYTLRLQIWEGDDQFALTEKDGEYAEVIVVE